MHYKKAVAGQISAGRQGIVPDRRLERENCVKLHGGVESCGNGVCMLANLWESYTLYPFKASLNVVGVS